ncbi:MAG: MFS transporter [Betaproteobacteria bacterium]|jgi:MFS family permease|nr:MFS transporter [Betaproteobacteria bacterium]MDH5343988.1 MFS transporter [Betaproteobacteria bacterium]
MSIRHTLRALRHRNYRLFFYGQTLSIIGNWVQQIAMAWLVYRLTESAWLLGVTGFAGQIAILVFAPFGGLWADRFDKHRLLLITQALSAVPPLLLAALTFAGLVEVWHIIVMALLLGIINAIDTPIRLAFTTEMVTVREDLPSAIAMNALMQSAGRMIGPTVAGLLLAVSTEAFCFVVNALSKVAIVATVLTMTIAPRAITRASMSPLQQLAEGARYAWQLIPIRWTLAIVAIISFMVTPYQTLMPIFAAEIYGGGASMLGFLMAAAGCGGVIGMLALASRRDVRGLTRWITFASLSAGIGATVFSLSPWLPLSLVALAMTGFGVVVNGMSVSTMIQTIVDDRMRGRIMGIFSVAFLGMYPLGSLAGGALAEHIGAPATLATGGGICTVAALVLWRRMPALRAALRPIYLKLKIIQ